MTDSEKKVCFIHSGKVGITVPFTYLLNEHFAKVFEDVIFLDVNRVFTSRLMPSNKQGSSAYSSLPAEFKVVFPQSLAEFKSFLKSHNIVVISLFSETWRDWYIPYYLNKYSIPLVYVHVISEVTSFRPYNSNKKRYLADLLRRLQFLATYVCRRFFSYGLPPEVDTLFISRKDKAEKKKKQSRFKEVVITNSRFYDEMLKCSYDVSNDYVVFLDSMLPYHLDQLRCGYPPWTDLERRLYYENLCRVLDTAASEMKKELVICLHPNYDERYLSRDFGGRRAVKYKTGEFVAKAEMVFFHESSSVNYAIMYGKKVVQLIGSDFNDFAKGNCQAYQKVLPFPVLDIYECSENEIRQMVQTLKPHREMYDAFMSGYIVASGHREICSSEQIADYISRKYGIPKRITE